MLDFPDPTLRASRSNMPIDPRVGGLRLVVPHRITYAFASCVGGYESSGRITDRIRGAIFTPNADGRKHNPQTNCMRGSIDHRATSTICLRRNLRRSLRPNLRRSLLCSLRQERLAFSHTKINRDFNKESRSSTGLGKNAYGASKNCCQFSTDRQTKSSTAVRLRMARIDLSEFFEDRVLQIKGHSRPLIDN